MTHGWEAKATSLRKECGIFASPHTLCYVISPYINKRSFSPLIVRGSLFGPILPALHLLHLAAFRIVLVAFDMCLLAYEMSQM